ncbi:MAG: hypothetical protein WD512_04680, partial [Candidatus Paceibacterota bacterium]
MGNFPYLQRSYEKKDLQHEDQDKDKDKNQNNDKDQYEDSDIHEAEIRELRNLSESSSSSYPFDYKNSLGPSSNSSSYYSTTSADITNTDWRITIADIPSRDIESRDIKSKDIESSDIDNKDIENKNIVNKNIDSRDKIDDYSRVLPIKLENDFKTHIYPDLDFFTNFDLARGRDQMGNFSKVLSGTGTQEKNPNFDQIGSEIITGNKSKLSTQSINILDVSHSLRRRKIENLNDPYKYA